jgi:hypothetical protein
VPKAYGSLTLGGYDNLRFNQSNNEYPFDTDDSKPLSIFVESISASNSLQGRTTLLDGTNTVYAAIDSTIPHLWLPREVCDRFEQAFGLLYDPATELYIAGDKNARDKIRNMNASITLGLGLNTGPAKRTNIVLPYAAFDLEASYPIYPNSTHYFPLRRAENNTQYRLGRTFLQEAYVIADYERSKFSIHQARFGNTMPAQSIVAIPPVQTSVNEKNESSIKPPENQERNQGSSLSRGAIIGVVFGVFIAIIISLSIFFRQKKKKKLSTQPIGAGNEPLPQELHWNVSKPPELEENMLCEMWQIPQELDSGVEVGVRRGDGSDTTV